MKNFKHIASVVALGALCAAPSSSRAQWIQNSSAGPFNYTDSANWNGGVINNQFLTNVTTGLTINFPANYTLTSAMLLAWSNNASVTFQSASSSPQTITLSPNGGITVSNSLGGIITIGTTNNPLIIDLHGATNCTIGGVAGTSGTANTTMNINAQVIDSVGGSNTLKLGGDRVFANLLNTNNTFVGPVNYYSLRGGSFASIKPIGGGPSALGAPTDSTNGTVSAADDGSNGSLRYTGPGDTTDRNFNFSLSFSNAPANAYQLANAGTGLLRLTGELSFPTNTTVGSQFLLFASNAPIEVDGYIHDTGNSNGTYTFICFDGGPTTAATNKIILTGTTNDFLDFEVSNVVLNCNSLAPAGTPCSIGAGTNLTLGGGSSTGGNWPGVGSQGCSLEYVGPSATLSRNIQINMTGAQCFWGIENSGTNTTLTISNNIVWNPLTNIFTGFNPRYLFLNVNTTATNTVYSAIPDANVVVGSEPFGIMVTAGAPVGSTIVNGGMVQLMNPANTFAGGVQISYARTIQAISLGDIGQPSSIGTGMNPGTLSTLSISLTGINLGSTDSQRGGVLAYIGTTNASSNQRITVLGSATGTQCSGTIRNDSSNGSSLHLSDTGMWNLQSVMPFCLATLGGSAAATNTIDSVVPDVGPTNAGSILVNGSAWRITAAQTYTGTTMVQTATMILNGSIATGLGTTVGSGGVLAVSNISGTLAVNDSFQLFKAGTYSGSFSSVSPATPGAGLAWDLSSLATTGTLKIIAGVTPSNPTITSVKASAGNINISGTNGTANGSYHVIGTTNVAQPLNQWTNVVSSSFDGSGDFSLTITNAVQPGVPRQFFRLEVP